MTGHVETEVSIGNWLNERTIVISDGLKTQTINICKPSNLREDGYERKYRIPIEHKFTNREIAQQPSLDTLYHYLTGHGAIRE